MSSIAVATVVVGAYSAHQAGKASKRAAATQAQIEGEKLDFATRQYDEYKEMYGGLEEDLVASIENFTQRDNLDRYTQEGVVDVRSAFGKARKMTDRNMARYGITPGDQRFFEQQKDTGLEEAKSEIFARQQARTKAEEEKIQDEDKLFSRRLAVGTFGKGIDPYSGGVTSAMTSSAELAGRQATGYAKQAGEGYGMVGKGLSQVSNKDWSSGDYGGEQLYGATQEPIWEGSNIVTDADTGDLGW